MANSSTNQKTILPGLLDEQRFLSSIPSFSTWQVNTYKDTNHFADVVHRNEHTILPPRDHDLNHVLHVSPSTFEQEGIVTNHRISQMLFQQRASANLWYTRNNFALIFFMYFINSFRKMAGKNDKSDNKDGLKNVLRGFSESNKTNKKSKRTMREPRFCFKTQSDVDVLDDGYKWRKYGHKVVKSIRHPRSYYRCTQENCTVKKTVERLAEDPRMVITTYKGRHAHAPSNDNHELQIDSCFQ